MPALHDETRARWGELKPDAFISTVVYGALREQIGMAHTVIWVYTQIIHSLPVTAALRLTHPPAPSGLREAFLRMRVAVSEAQDIVQNDGETITLTSYTAEGHILRLAGTLQEHIRRIEQEAEAVVFDRHTQIALDSLNGRCLSDIAADILDHLHDASALLEFAQAYAQRQVVARHARS